jgi:uncharacterized membrane protein HdeD (DUF308 family)
VAAPAAGRHVPEQPREGPMTMSVPEDSAVVGYPAVAAHRHWLRLILGVLAIAIGVAAFAWPAATVKVIAILFGINLLVTGFFRAGLLLFLPGYPVLYRVLGITFGVLVGFIGILCLRNLAGSLTLLLFVVALGWMLDGLVQIFLGVGGTADGGRGWSIASGLLLVLGGIALLVWPKIGLGAFIFVGATVLVFVGLAQVISAVAGMRTRQR